MKKPKSLLLLVLFPEMEKEAEICSFHVIAGVGALKQASTMRLMIKSLDLARVQCLANCGILALSGRHYD